MMAGCSDESAGDCFAADGAVWAGESTAKILANNTKHRDTAHLAGFGMRAL
jgi:hypothetical protein